MEKLNVNVVENYKGFVIVKFNNESMHRIFSAKDGNFEKELGGFMALDKAKAKIDSLTVSSPAPAPQEPEEVTRPNQESSPATDKAKALSIEKIREKYQDIEALFIGRDQAKTTLRDLTIMRNENAETNPILCTFTEPKSGKKVNFSLHAQELLEKGIAITERSLEAVEFMITQRERTGA